MARFRYHFWTLKDLNFQRAKRLSICLSYNGLFCLTGLYRMDFPIFIIWTILFTLGGIFHFYSNFDRIICKKTVENLIRRRVLRRLIWFCTVCRCPTKRTLRLEWVKSMICLKESNCTIFFNVHEDMDMSITILKK